MRHQVDEILERPRGELAGADRTERRRPLAIVDFLGEIRADVAEPRRRAFHRAALARGPQPRGAFRGGADVCTRPALGARVESRREKRRCECEKEDDAGPIHASAAAIRSAISAPSLRSFESAYAAIKSE